MRAIRPESAKTNCIKVNSSYIRRTTNCVFSGRTKSGAGGKVLARLAAPKSAYDFNLTLLH